VRDHLRITGRREGAVAVIEVSDTGPGVARKRARICFEAFQGLDPARRSGLGWPSRRTGARPWRRDPPGRRHDRRDVPPDHPDRASSSTRAAESGPSGAYSASPLPLAGVDCWPLVDTILSEESLFFELDWAEIADGRVPAAGL